MVYKQIICILIIILIIILILLILLTNKETFITTPPNIFISYIYFEKENTKKNLEFFLKHGLKNNMYMIINVKDHKISIDINKYNKDNNIKIRKTDNVGFDFGGHRDNLKEINFNDYDYFILMNDSCMGPFYKTGNWYDAFINKNKSIVGTIKLHSYFLFITKNSIGKIHEIIKSNKTDSYINCVRIEYFIKRSKLSKSNVSTINRWQSPHNPFDVIFVKENRIGRNKGFRGRGRGFNFITELVLKQAKQYMELNIDNNTPNIF
jgi:hypothetical protein